MEGHRSPAAEDRLSLSHDLDLLADQIAVQGAARRAHELRLVAAMLRDKAEGPGPQTSDPAAGPAPAAVPDPGHRREDYLLAASLFVAWLIVVLTVVALGAATLGATSPR